MTERTPEDDLRYLEALVTMAEYSDTHSKTRSDPENTLSWVYQTLDMALRIIKHHSAEDSYAYKAADVALSAAELELINNTMPRPVP